MGFEENNKYLEEIFNRERASRKKAMEELKKKELKHEEFLLVDWWNGKK